MKNATEIVGEYTPSQIRAIGAAALVSGSISILGACFMILSFFLFMHKLKALFFRLVFFLSIADLGCSIVMVFGAAHLIAKQAFPEDTSFVCQIQGCLIQLFYQMANGYISMIATVLYRAIVLKKTRMSIAAELICHILIWATAIILSLLPVKNIGGAKYANAGAWCWLSSSPKYARFVYLYIFVWLVIAAIIVINIWIWLNFRSLYTFTLKSPNEGTHRKVKNIYRRLFMYPLAFIILWTPSTLNRVIQAFFTDMYALTLVQAVILPLSGIIDALVYGFTTVLQEDYRKLFSKIRNIETVDVKGPLVNSTKM